MNLQTLGLVLLSVSLSALAQLLLKMGMSSADVARALLDAPPLRMALAIASNRHVLAGLVLYFTSAAVWLFVLARLQLSMAYPFVGLGFIVTMLLGWLFLDDPLSTTRVAGTLLVTVGVVLIARS